MSSKNWMINVKFPRQKVKKCNPLAFPLNSSMIWLPINLQCLVISRESFHLNLSCLQHNKWNRYFYYIKFGGIPSGNKLIKTMRSPHMWRYWPLISLISSLSLNLYLNSLLYHWNFFGSSSKVFRNLQTSSQKFSEILWKCLGTFVWPSEQFWTIFGKWSEIFGKSSKMLLSVCLYNKKNIILAQRYEFYVLVAWTISHSFVALTCEIFFLPLEHKIHIFSLPCNILYFI